VIAGTGPSPAEEAKLRGHILRDLGNGHPIVCTVGSGFRPPGYPATGRILHYVTAIGHRNGADKTLIADPGAEARRSGLDRRLGYAAPFP
jgi:hypothetical protein